jgi:hypothetical protein
MSHIALSLWAALGSIGLVPASASPLPQDHEGWVFGSEGFAVGLEPLPSKLRIDKAPEILALWERALGTGPRLSPLLARGLQAGIGRGELQRLGLLASLGLSGGPAARASLELELGRRSSSRGAEELVVAVLAYGRPRVSSTCASLADGLGKRRRQPVETLSASLVSFALARRNGAKDCVSLENPPELRELVAAMRVAVAPDLERAKDWRPVPFPPEAPAAGTLGELQVRATLLALAERPRLAREEELRRIASWPAPFATLAAFVLGRRSGQAKAAELERADVDLASYLAGASHIEGELEARLLRGADAVRPNAWRGRFWAAAMRLVRVVDRDALLALMLEREEQVAEVDFLQAALMEWARRQLLGELRAKLDDVARGRLAQVARRIGGELGWILSGLIGEELFEDESVTPRMRATIERYFAGRLGTSAQPGGTLMWLRLVEHAWLRPAGGLASPRAVQLEELNRLVFDLLVRGGDFGKQHWPGDRPPWLPKGVPQIRDDYFGLLSLQLTRYPIYQH